MRTQLGDAEVGKAKRRENAAEEHCGREFAPLRAEGVLQ
jgi:hypothetical protein